MKAGDGGREEQRKTNKNRRETVFGKNYANVSTRQQGSAKEGKLEKRKNETQDEL